MDEIRIARTDADETLKRLTREGNRILSLVATDTEYVIRYERRTEIRDGV